MKILKSGIEMTPEELRESKAGKRCACSCQMSYDTADLHLIGDEDHSCYCGCIPPPGQPNTWYGASGSAYSYPW